MEREIGPERARALMKYQGVARLSKQDARDIITTLWPKAPSIEVKKAMLICVQYNLNPLMKHLFILGPFTNRKTGEESWAIALGIKTNRLLASRQRRYSYFDDTPRVMTEDEQKKIFGNVDDDKLWAITKVKDEHGNTAQGYGHWRKNEGVYGEEKGNTQENMAFIRSERQALDRLFPDALPTGVEVVDERFVDTRTGEIIEGEHRLIDLSEGEGKVGESEEVKPEQFAAEVAREAKIVAEEAKRQQGAPTSSPKAKPTKPEPPASELKLPDDVTQDDVPDLNALCRICFHFYKLQPFQVWKELGYKSMLDVTETPWECWQKIRAART